MSNFLRRRRRCPHGLEQCFLGDDYIPVSRFGSREKDSFGQDFSKLVFNDGENGLDGSRGRHVDSIELSLFILNRMGFVLIFLGYLFLFLSFVL
jgi:hypothetical protein